MPLIRERAQCLGKNSIAFYANSDFTSVCTEYNAVNTNDIASVQQVEQLPFSVCQGILTEVELNVASCVTKSCKCSLAMITDNHQATCKSYVFAGLFQRICIFNNLSAGVIPVKGLAKWFISKCADLVKLANSDFSLFVSMLSGLFCHNSYLAFD